MQVASITECCHRATAVASLIATLPGASALLLVLILSSTSYMARQLATSFPVAERRNQGSLLLQTYSAFRESSFGHGILDFLNSTTVVWNWQRNQDALNAKTGDTVSSPILTSLPVLTLDSGLHRIAI